MSASEDVSAQIVLTFRDYAATKSSPAEAEQILAEALGETGAPGLDPRAWVSLPVFERVATRFMDRFGETFTTDAMTWAIPLRRNHSAMSLSALATPDLFYRHLDRARSFYARHLRFEVYPAGSGALRAQLHYRPDAPRTKASCGVGRAVLLGVPLLFDLPPAEVVESHCWADGAPCCTYDVRFRTEPPLAWIAFVVGTVLAVIGWLLLPTAWWAALPAVGWMAGRELYLLRVRRVMTRVSEEHRRLLAENEREFERRFRAMRDLNASLEQRIELRTADLRRAMRELRERNAALRSAMEDMKALHGEVLEAGAERVLDDALRELEHEINNPVAFVLANLDHLSADEPEKGDLGELAATVDDIRVGIDRIRSVVGWFIELHRAGGPLTRLDVARELRTTVKHLERRWEGRVTVDLDLAEVFVPGRGRQLMQVFVNILKNAGEAMSAGRVRVAASQVGDRVRIRIEDDGPGIPPEALPRVFERGFSTKAKEGMGLGLHISQQIVERHGGRISVTSPPGGGAAFEVDLPAWVEPSDRPPSGATRSARASLPD